MPRGSPFTTLCRQFAGLDGPRGADLHVHTTASDGAFTPSQAVALARQAKLKAIAITDHDTLAALAEARQTARDMPEPLVEVVSGVEITTLFRGREQHLLGYFIRDDHETLNALLTRSCDLRRDRFRRFLDRLAGQGIAIPPEAVSAVERVSTSLGRRHLASLLVRCGKARTYHEAWQRHVGPLTKDADRPAWPRIEEAIAIVRDAEGVPSLAHPPLDLEESDFESLRDAGMMAVEAVYPWSRSSMGSRLRGIADRLGLLISGGSDCHGAEPRHRSIGSHLISIDEMEQLRHGTSLAGTTPNRKR